jgi:eukaryotic-like serine/threonine-protein kinase
MSPAGESPWAAPLAQAGASALAGPAAPPGAPSLPGGSSSPGATPLPGDSVGHGEPRHGKPGRGRAVEILPAVPAAQLADPYDGMNHTLIVSGPGPHSADEDEPISGLVHRPSGYGRREPRLQQWLFSRKFAYAALAAAVVLILGLLGWWVISGQYVAVPPVGGLAKATAATELRNLGFKVKTVHGVHDNAVARGHVIRTDPAIGSRAHRGSVIALVPSLGPVQVQVPSVTGMKVADAEAALRRAGLIPGRVKSAASTTIPLGVVISTDPIAGLSWPQTKPVTIVESAGQPLPELVGQQESAAQQLSQQDGFQLNPEQDKNSSQPAGTITSQSPRPGTPITPGEVVTIRVSAGPQLVAIPDVQGMPAQQAIAVLQQAGFQVNVDTLSRGHRVFGYNPTGQAPKGTTITIFVGFGGF